MKVYYLIFLLGLSCGVEVGNPTKPLTAATPPAADQAALALSVADQYQESVASNVENDDGSEDALVLTDSQTCSPGSDGTVNLSSEKSKAHSSNFPRNNPKRTISVNGTIQTHSTLSSESGPVQCNAAGTAATVDLASLKSFKVSSQVTRDFTRSDSEVATGTVLKSSKDHIESTRVRSSKILSFQDKIFEIEKTIDFHSSVTHDSANAVTSGTKTPLVIHLKRSRGELQNYTISSGSVNSAMADGRQLLLTYNKLAMQVGSQCHPIDGSIQAEVFATTADTVAAYSFQIIFTADESHLLFPDGSTQDLPVGDCSFSGN